MFYVLCFMFYDLGFLRKIIAVPQKDSNSPRSGSLTKNLLAAYRRLWEARPRGELSGNARFYRRDDVYGCTSFVRGRMPGYDGAPPTSIKYFRYADTVQFHFYVEND